MIMGLKDCKIVLLNNKNNVYKPGDIIKGYVEYVFDSTKKVRGIFVTFKGLAETLWIEEKNEKPKITEKQCGKEEYFNESYYLLGNIIAFHIHKIEIPKGTHRYFFSCTLPATLPSSFEGECGFIRYTIKVTLERPWKFNQETKMAFTIINDYNLNLCPQLKLPTNIHIDETFCCFLCKSSPIVIDVFIPLSGYCSGQNIPIEIICQNGSNVDINQIVITLRQIVQYVADLPNHTIKTVRKEISEIQLESTKKRSQASWQKSLKIPSVPPTSLGICRLIDIHYDIKVKCLHTGLYSDIKQKTSISLGTVPIVEALSNDLQNCNKNNNNHSYTVKDNVEYKEGLYYATSILEENENPLILIQHKTPFTPKYPSYTSI